MGVLADFITLFGLGLLAYGLWLFEPWVCYAVIGFILMLAGGAMAKQYKKE